MKLMAISLFLIFLMPLAAALTFDFNSPASANLGENFSVSISAITSDDYDVKIFVQNNETKPIISEIYSEAWKNPYYYLKAIFPDKSDFIIRIKNISSDAVICVRLRKVSSTSYSEHCKEITIAGEKVPNQSTNNKIVSSNKTSGAETELASKTISNEDFSPSSASESSEKQDVQSQIQGANPGKIFLNSKSLPNTSFVTKDQKLRIYAVYAFTGLTIITLVFLVIKKL